MKRCTKCSASIKEVALFCPKCGAKQENATPQDRTEQKSNTNNAKHQQPIEKSHRKTTLLPNTEASATESSNPAGKKWRNTIYIGVGIVVLSVFSSVITITGFSIKYVSMMEFNAMLGLTVLGICAAVIYMTRKRQYHAAILSGNIFLLFVVFVIFGYINLLSTMQKSTMGNLAFMSGFSIDLGFGVLLLLFGAVFLEFGGILCGMKADPEDSKNFIAQWIKYTVHSVEIKNIRVPGLLVIAIAVATMMFFTSQSNFVQSWTKLTPANQTQKNKKSKKISSRIDPIWEMDGKFDNVIRNLNGGHAI